MYKSVASKMFTRYIILRRYANEVIDGLYQMNI